MMTAAETFDRDYVRPEQGRTLIVGSHVYPGKHDRRMRFADAIGVDLIEGPGVDVVLDMELDMPLDWQGSFNHVECLSVLEHSPRPWLIAENIERVLKVGGTLHCEVPFIFDYHAYPQDFFRFTPDGMRALFPRIEWDIVMLGHHSITKRKRAGRVHLGVPAHPWHPRTETYGFGRLRA